jgi:leucyl-tRNA synthetase
MRDLGLVKLDEPFTNLLTQGMVLNRVLNPAEVEVTSRRRGRARTARSA